MDLNEGISRVKQIPDFPRAQHQLVIEEVQLQVVFDKDKDRFNSNNHWGYTISDNKYVKATEPQIPENFDQIIELTQIYDFTINTIIPKITHLESYVIDLGLLGKDNQPYFIEINGYGHNRASGSSLFHWIHDEAVFLRGDDVQQHIYFRYVI